ncbi:hypothetical protein ACFFX0_01295 [Citricoccus parietis]|uniref:Uncharacterized protein n=1 Tax=Citricoccus parietis TaxID=592307 RepID=A0ABV5FTA6_9MICC
MWPHTFPVSDRHTLTKGSRLGPSRLHPDPAEQLAVNPAGDPLGGGRRRRCHGADEADLHRPDTDFRGRELR